MLKSLSVYCMEVCVTYTFVTMSSCLCVLSRFVHSVHPNLSHSRPEWADMGGKEGGGKGEKKLENQTVVADLLMCKRTHRHMPTLRCEHMKPEATR